MTNWMTAAGLAMIAGGLAVLIGFRQVLLGGGRDRRRPGRRADFSVPAQIRARRRRESLAAAPAASTGDAARAEHAHASPGGENGADAPDPLNGDLRSDDAIALLEAAPQARSEHNHASPATGAGEPGAAAEPATAGPAGPAGSVPAPVPAVDAGLAGAAGSVSRVGVAGLVGAAGPVCRVGAAGLLSAAGPVSRVGDAGPVGAAEPGPAEGEEPQTGTLAALGEIEPAPTPARSREGDRVAGWIRPEYDEEPASPGEYWTPIPESRHTGDASYGWPVPIERLPPVPAYPPQSGFDLESFAGAAVGEATSVVPQWPPAQPSERIELPRNWASRNVQNRSGAEKEPRRRSAMRRRVQTPDTPTLHTQSLPAVNDSEPTQRNNRPRPRPRPAQADRSNVYRSRHAADHD